MFLHHENIKFQKKLKKKVLGFKAKLKNDVTRQAKCVGDSYIAASTRSPRCINYLMHKYHDKTWFSKWCSPLGNSYYFWTSQQQICFIKFIKNLIFVKSLKKKLVILTARSPTFHFCLIFRPSFCYTGFTEWYVLLTGWRPAGLSFRIDPHRVEREKDIFN